LRWYVWRDPYTRPTQDGGSGELDPAIMNLP